MDNNYREKSCATCKFFKPVESSYGVYARCTWNDFDFIRSEDDSNDMVCFEYKRKGV